MTRSSLSRPSPQRRQFHELLVRLLKQAQGLIAIKSMTDSSGEISAWDIGASLYLGYSYPTQPFSEEYEISTENIPGENQEDNAGQQIFSDFGTIPLNESGAFASSVGGVWSETSETETAPEPGTISLGLIGGNCSCGTKADALRHRWRLRRPTTACWAAVNRASIAPRRV